MNTVGPQGRAKKRIALFSLSDTTRADEFALRLVDAGWLVVASRETVEHLARGGVTAQDIADLTGVHDDLGFPPTLHPRIEHALTMDGELRIDLVYVIPYARSAGNDVGGRTLLALAVKGGRIAAMNIEDMSRVVTQIAATGTAEEALRRELADKACYEISTHYSSLIEDTSRFDVLSGRHHLKLAYGENPYQTPAHAFSSDRADEPLSLLRFAQVSGDAPCLTNVADADSLLHTLCLTADAFARNTGATPNLCVAAKHGNACGVGVDALSPAQAINRALFGNPRAVWGGEVAVNFSVDEPCARLLLKSDHRAQLLGKGSWMLDLVMAPHFSPEARAILGKRSRRKLFENPALAGASIEPRRGALYRMVRGGFLRQPLPTYVLDLHSCDIDGPQLATADIPSLIVAWAVAFTSNHGGNEIALAKDGALLGAGGGPATVDAVTVAVSRAKEHGHNTQGASFAANAFFPFTDAPTSLCDAGVVVGCVPGGGKREPEVRSMFQDRNVTVAYLPAEFRGFSRH